MINHRVMFHLRYKLLRIHVIKQTLKMYEYRSVLLNIIVSINKPDWRGGRGPLSTAQWNAARKELVKMLILLRSTQICLLWIFFLFYCWSALCILLCMLFQLTHSSWHSDGLVMYGMTITSMWSKFLDVRLTTPLRFAQGRSAWRHERISTNLVDKSRETIVFLCSARSTPHHEISSFIIVMVMEYSQKLMQNIRWILNSTKVNIQVEILKANSKMPLCRDMPFRIA